MIVSGLVVLVILPLILFYCYLKYAPDLKKHLNIMGFYVWEMDAVVTLIPQRTFNPLMLKIKLAEIRKYFSLRGQYSQSVKIGLGENSLNNFFQGDGETLCATIHTDRRPNGFVSQGVLTIMREGIITEQPLCSWIVCFDQNFSTITEKKAIIFIEGQKHEKGRILILRAGKDVRFSFEQRFPMHIVPFKMG